jgi:hypothetical protein
VSQFTSHTQYTVYVKLQKTNHKDRNAAPSYVWINTSRVICVSDTQEGSKVTLDIGGGGTREIDVDDTSDSVIHTICRPAKES